MKKNNSKFILIYLFSAIFISLVILLGSYFLLRGNLSVKNPSVDNPEYLTKDDSNSYRLVVDNHYVNNLDRKGPLSFLNTKNSKLLEAYVNNDKIDTISPSFEDIFNRIRENKTVELKLTYSKTFGFNETLRITLDFQNFVFAYIDEQKVERTYVGNDSNKFYLFVENILNKYNDLSWFNNISLDGKEITLDKLRNRNLKITNLYASIKRNKKIKYLVRFDENGGILSPSTEKDNLIVQGKTIKIPENPYKKGYRFDKWVLKKDNSPYDFNTPIEKDIELMATWVLETYYVNFSNEINPTFTYTYESDDIKVKNASKKGYNFDGYEINNDGSRKKDYVIKHNTVGNLEFRPFFSPKTYKISYKYFFLEQDGTHKEYDLILQNIPIQTEAKYETQYILNQTDPITRQNEDQEGIPNGYIFEKYYIKLEDGTFEERQQTGIYRQDKDITVYKKYVSNNYTLSFDLNSDGDETNPSVIQPISKQRYTSIVLPKAPLRKGYIFKGWKKGSQFVLSPYLGQKDALLKAVWEKQTYTITFNPKGGLWSVNTFTNVDRDSQGEVVYQVSRLYQQVIHTAPLTQREGYILEGWFTSKNGIEKKLFENNSGLTVEDDLYIYAKWTPKAYNIKYKYETNDQGEIIEKPINENYSDSFKLLIPNNSYKGKRFLGWTIEGQDDNTIINDNNLDKIPFNKEVTLKAKWGENVYVVTIDTKGGSKIDPILVEYNKNIPNKLQTEKIGKELEGWYLDKEYSDKINLDSYLVTKDITIYAKWQNIRYQITYDLQGGTINNGSNPLSYDIETKHELIKPTLLGHDFTGWTIENNTTIPNPLINIYKGNTGDIKLIANYTPHIYNVTYFFEDSNGEKKSSTIQIPYNTELTLPEILKVKPGHEFKGWYYLTDQNRQRIDHTKFLDTENIYLEAKIVPIQYSVLFLDTTGNKISELKVFANDTIIDEEYRNQAVLPGKSFYAWFSENGKVDFPHTVKTNITLTARLNHNRYTIRYYYDETSFEEEKVSFGYSVNQKRLTDKTGYINLGWYLYNKDSHTFSDKQLNSIYNYPHDITVRQKLVKKVFYVSYDLQGGTFIDDQGNEQTNVELQEKFPYGESIKKLPKVKKDGFEFSYWQVNYSNSPLVLPYTVFSNVNISAVWTNRYYKYTLVNEFRNTLREESTYGNKILNLENESDVTGYNFLYWYYLEDGKEVQFKSGLYKFGKNMTFYAKYKKQRYLVKFYGPKETNNIKQNNQYDYVLYDYKNFYDYEEKIIPPTPVQIKDMEFVGWSESRDTQYSRDNKVANYPSFPLLANQNKSYFAVYKPIIWKITYIDLENNNKKTIDTQVVNGGSYTNLKILESNYYRTFKGWAFEEDEKNYTLLDQVFLYQYGKDITLYAKWHYKNTLISFSNYYNNSSNIVAYIDINEYKKHEDYITHPDYKKLKFDFVKDKPYRVLEASKFYPAGKLLKEEDMLYPVIDGFELNGYSRGDLKLDFENFKVYSSTTVYAMVRKRSFTLYLHFQDQEDEGRNNKERVILSRGISSSSNFTSLNPSRFNYKFKHWSFEKNNPNGKPYNSNEFKNYGDEVHLYAIWDKKVYTITFKNMDKTDYYLNSPGNIDSFVSHKNGWSESINYEKYNLKTFTEEDEIDLTNLIPIHSTRTFTHWNINGKQGTKIPRGTKQNVDLSPNFEVNHVYFKIRQIYKPETDPNAYTNVIETFSPDSTGYYLNYQNTRSFLTEKGQDPDDLEKQYFIDKEDEVGKFINPLFLKGVGRTRENPIKLIPLISKAFENNKRKIIIFNEEDLSSTKKDYFALGKENQKIISRGSFITKNDFGSKFRHLLTGIKVEYQNGVVKEFNNFNNYNYYEIGQEFDENGNQLIEKTITPLYTPFEYNVYFMGKDNLPYQLIFTDKTIEVNDGAKYTYKLDGRQGFVLPKIKIKGYNTNVEFIVKDEFGTKINPTNSSTRYYNIKNDLYVYFDNVTKITYKYKISFTTSSNSNSDTIYTPNSSFNYSLRYNEDFKTPDYEEISLGVVGYELDGYILNFKNPNPVPGRHPNFFLPGTVFRYTQDKDLDMKALLKEEVFGFRVHTNGGKYKYNYYVRNNNIEYDGFTHSYEELIKDPSLEEEKIIWFSYFTFRDSFITAYKTGYNFSRWGLSKDQNSDREYFSPDKDQIFSSRYYKKHYRYELHNVPKIITREHIPDISPGNTIKRKVVILDIFAVWTPKNPSVYLYYSNINNKNIPNANTSYSANFGSIHQFPYPFYNGYKYLGWRIRGTQDELKHKFFVGSREINPDKDNLDDYIYITDNTNFEIVFEKTDQNMLFMDKNLEYILDNDSNFIKIPENINSIAQIYKNEDNYFKNLKKATIKNDETFKTIYNINGYSYTNFYSYTSNSTNNTITQDFVKNENSIVKLSNWRKEYNIKLKEVIEGNYELVYPYEKYVYGYQNSLPDAKLQNYEFLGWIIEEATNSNIDIQNYKIPQKNIILDENTYGDITLKPVFRPLNITIYYNLGYQEINNPNPKKHTIIQQVKATEPQIFLLQPKRRGYKFINWQRGSSSHTLSYTGTKEDKIYLTANWEKVSYRINYNYGGANSSNNYTTYNVESSFDLTNPEKKGAIFKGWLSSYEENGKTDGTTPQLTFKFRAYDEEKQFDSPENIYSRVGDLNLVAVFEDNRYDLTFNYNFSNIPISINKIGYNEKFTAPNVQKNGFTIRHWTYNGQTFYPGREYTYNYLYNVELNAVWSNEIYSVSFENEINIDYLKEYGHENDKFKYGDFIREPKLPNINEYVVRWYNKEIPDETIQFPYKVVKNITITYEKAKKRHSIYYDLDGGINSEFNPISYSLSDLNSNNIRIENPTRYGYRFLGWSYNFDKALNKHLRINAEKVYGPLLIKAHWQAIYNKVTYDTLYNEEKYLYEKVPYDGFAENKQINNPVGYQFVHWYENEPSVPFDFSRPILKDTVLKAYYYRYENVEKIIYSRKKPTEVAILFNRFVPYLDNTNYSKEILNEISKYIEVINGRKPINIYGLDNNKLVLVFEPNSISENMIITLNKDLPIYSGNNYQVGLLKEEVKITYYNRSFVSYVKAKSFTQNINEKVIGPNLEKVLTITIKESNATVTPIFKFNSEEERNKVSIIPFDSIKQLNQFQYIIKQKEHGSTGEPINVTFTIELPELSQKETINVTLK